jgi:hypothetical protein
VITPCANGVCPEASGGFTPAALADGVTSRFIFQERQNGRVQGVLAFNDPSPDAITLNGCTTESAACRLTVTTFACSDTHAVTIAGNYTPQRGTPTAYKLTLSGVAREPGTFTLSAGAYQYTLTQDGIVDVTCPPVAGVVAGQR